MARVTSSNARSDARRCAPALGFTSGNVVSRDRVGWQWGRFKGTSAYESLTAETVQDWLSMLGFHPGEAHAAAAW